MKFILLIISFCLFGQAYGQDSARGLLIKFNDTCYKLQKQAGVKKILGTDHSLPLFVANRVIVAQGEIDINLIDSITILKCPESFERFGYLAANGVILISTKQKFEVVKLIDIIKERQLIAGNSKVVYALNGYFFSDTLLEFSKAAIVKAEIVECPGINNLEIYKNVSCINIWTVTEKELDQDKLVPRNSRLP